MGGTMKYKILYELHFTDGGRNCTYVDVPDGYPALEDLKHLFETAAAFMLRGEDESGTIRMRNVFLIGENYEVLYEKSSGVL